MFDASRGRAWSEEEAWRRFVTAVAQVFGGPIEANDGAFMDCRTGRIITARRFYLTALAQMDGLDRERAKHCALIEAGLVRNPGEVRRERGPGWSDDAVYAARRRARAALARGLRELTIERVAV